MTQNLRHVDIYTDGACSGNPGPGGWAAILKYGNHVKELDGSMPQTTNNRMELFAVISGLGALKEPCRVRIHSDSTYIVDAFNMNWVDNWQQNGWKTADKKPVENQDLWRLLLLTMRRHQVSFHKVPGHSDHKENNRCDALAKAAIQSLIRSLNSDENDIDEQV
jgi:ribonuclease HI